jgi:thiol-disulfide isomerase/thioredoxin
MKKAILFFWATWCPHCRRELQELYQKREELAKKNVQLAVVNLGEGVKEVTRYLEKQKMQDLELILDKKETYAEEYGVIGLPTYFFVDEKGIIRDMQHGLPDDLEKSFSQN